MPAVDGFCFGGDENNTRLTSAASWRHFKGLSCRPIRRTDFQTDVQRSASAVAFRIRFGL